SNDSSSNDNNPTDSNSTDSNSTDSSSTDNVSTDINSNDSNSAENIVIENNATDSITIKQSKDGFMINIPMNNYQNSSKQESTSVVTQKVEKLDFDTPISEENDGNNQDEIDSSQESNENDGDD
ncbi:hypothetical protein, partial [Gottfriedia acidiceleris]|uniref:hypothetical protein n=1 Tax=Gottfriedia acidiceleris TaxID=371036 RepID=UPI003B589A5B